MPALSVSESVGDAAKAAVEALALPGLAATAVVKRKMPGVPEGAKPGLPQVVISIGEEGAVEKIDALTDLVRYPVAVTIVTEHGAKAADDPAVRDWRQRIRLKLQDDASWALVSGFNTVTTAGRAPFDPAALSKGFNYSTVIFTVEVLEDRT